MGIRGLTTHIAQYSERYLEPYELKCCTLVIDGNSIACQLYNEESDCISAFGGDYDKYAYCVKRFFRCLKKCEITPLVLLDGGYESKKIRTVKSRLRGKLMNTKAATSCLKKCLNVFPLFMREVFVDVMRSLNVSFVQCDFEADSEIAAIARRLNCPVLSYDSDFYVFDVLYIPFSVFELEPVKYISEPDKIVKYYIKCQIYKIETFLNSCGGMDKSLLPVLAVLLGNDYFQKHQLYQFLSQIKLPNMRGMRESQRRIVAILQWLKYETQETAVKKILNRLKKDRRPALLEALKEVISGYTNVSSDLLPLLCKTEGNSLGSENMFTNEDTPTHSSDHADLFCLDKLVDQTMEEENTDYLEDEEKELQGEEESTENSADECSESKFEDIDCDKVEHTFPAWFKESFRKGDLPPTFMNMLVLQTYFFVPQVEEFTMSFSHRISLPILGVIFGLLTKGHKYTPQLNCVAYNRHNLKQVTLVPIYRTNSVNDFPSFNNVNDLTLHVKKSLIYDTVEFDSFQIQILNLFPDDWKILILSLVYWVKNVTEPTITIVHVHALLFSIIALNVIDGHLGYCRSKKRKTGKNKCPSQKTDKKNTKSVESGTVSDKENAKLVESGTVKTDKENTKSVESEELNGGVSVIDALKVVSKNDCLQVSDQILPFHALDETLRARPKLFSLELLHAFAQFQSCLYSINHLNALLNFPLPQCKIADFYSGTLIYNAYMNFKTRSDVQQYVLTHVLNSPSLGSLYSVLLSNMFSLLPCLLVTETSTQVKQNRRQRKRKPKKKKTVTEPLSSNEECVSEIDEISEFMENNKFFALRMK